MKRRYSSIIFALLLFAIPAFAVFSGSNLSVTLKNLRNELEGDYHRISLTQEKLSTRYEEQHQKMVDIIKQCNELSLMLYSQKPDYTFDLSFALEKVTREYNDFNEDRMPYDRIVNALDIEIDRYARLIESLRRLPPELNDLEVVPDSLAYHNDTLDFHLQKNESLLQQALEQEMTALAEAEEKGEHPFLLDKEGEVDRDSCLFYASELLKMYADSKNQAVSDSIHYREAYLRLKESYDYAMDYYKVLQRNVFTEGQTPWNVILADPGKYWQLAKDALREKFNPDYWKDMSSKESEPGEGDAMINDSRASFVVAFINILFHLFSFLLIWGLVALIVVLIYRFVKPVRKYVTKEQRHYIILLLTCLLFLSGSGSSGDNEMVDKAAKLANTFIWLLAAIYAALLLRLKPEKLKMGVHNYTPIIVTALFVIGCRVLFLPNAVMNFIFPPLLLILVLWQLYICLTRGRKSDKPDAVIGWISLGVTAVAMITSWTGFIFLSLLILVWWYFQLAAILTLTTVWHLLEWYKETRLNKKLAQYRDKITFVSGPDKEKLMFGATWFYELIRNVVIPVAALLSVPLCVRLSIGVFEFNDLYDSIFVKPFILFMGKDGTESFHMSLNYLILLGCLAFVFHYADKVLHTIWQSFRYHLFMRKYNRTSIRNNEINMSLGNSIISVVVWFTYIVIVIVTLQIPTGSLGLIAGGLSAGIGIALKDILNNFIYGIQLMGGRLRVGDWIECDGVRGRVSDINYQSTLVVTENATQVAFLNAALFNKNFTNLTRNNSYELTKLIVGVEYGTDIQHVREVLESAMEVMKTKDKYGRDVVDPAYGINVRFSDFGESSVNIAVKQYVLVAERVAYVDKAKEVIYTALNNAGITIPFPQCDVHMKDN